MSSDHDNTYLRPPSRDPSSHGDDSLQDGPFSRQHNPGQDSRQFADHSGDSPQSSTNRSSPGPDTVSQQGTFETALKRLPAPQHLSAICRGSDSTDDGHYLSQEEYGDNGWPKRFTESERATPTVPQDSAKDTNYMAGGGQSVPSWGYDSSPKTTPALSFRANSPAFHQGILSHGRDKGQIEPDPTTGSFFTLGKLENYKLTKNDVKNLKGRKDLLGRVGSLSFHSHPQKSSLISEMKIPSLNWIQVTNTSNRPLYLKGNQKEFMVWPTQSLGLGYTGREFVEVSEGTTAVPPQFQRPKIVMTDVETENKE